MEMGFGVLHWIIRNRISIHQHTIQEKNKMRRQIEKLEVKRIFEPNRLSLTNLERAYEKILPKHIRVIERHSNPVGDEKTTEKQSIRRKIR
jgi:hypothetical protein